METKIVIFLAFTALTLAFNSVIIWLAYKSFSSITTKMTETIREIESSDSTRAWLKALETASSQAVILTTATKTQLNNFEPVLAQAQSKYGFRLAQLDVQMEKSLATIQKQTEKMQKALQGPAQRFSTIGATLSGVQEVIRYLSGMQSVDDASSTPKK
ncbi:MAG TPA: hypothetical protein VMB70_14815 [Terriglobia bacterium]|nr:hypothetical protein [Terriglobia bacterium]